MVSVVEQLMQMHVKALNDLGVDLLKDKGIKDQNKEKSKQKDKYKKPIEDLI
jgi:hypothetical protein